jgi:predicted HD phosphohydrolase
MKDGSAEDYALLGRLEKPFVAATPERIMEHLGLLRGSFGGYRVDRLQHCLQSATRAERDGADDDWVVAALLHDIGDLLCPQNHSQVAAAVLAPFVREEVHWTVRHHGLFQGYYYFHHNGGDRHARERYADHPHYRSCADFCERWDQCSFDPDYDTLPLAHFALALRRVFERVPFAGAASSGTSRDAF